MAFVDIPGVMRYPAYAGYTNNTWGVNNTTLDAAEEAICCVLQAPWSGTLKKVYWNLNANTVSASSTLKVRIEAPQSTGDVLATTIAGSTLYDASGSTDVELNGLSTGVQSTQINGTTGITVTKGDMIAVVFRISNITGTISISREWWGGPIYQSLPITAQLTTGSWSSLTLYRAAAIGFDLDGTVQRTIGCWPYPASGSSRNVNNTGWSGFKFQLPFRCKVLGFQGQIYNWVDDPTVKLFSSSGSVACTLPSQNAAAFAHSWEMPMYLLTTSQIIEADTWYRFALTGGSGSNTAHRYIDYSSNTEFVNAYPWQGNGIVTYSSETNPTWASDWTDEQYTDNPLVAVLIDEIDVGSAAATNIIYPSNNALLKR